MLIRFQRLLFVHLAAYSVSHKSRVGHHVGRIFRLQNVQQSCRSARQPTVLAGARVRRLTRHPNPIELCCCALTANYCADTRQTMWA